MNRPPVSVKKHPAPGRWLLLSSACLLAFAPAVPGAAARSRLLPTQPSVEVYSEALDVLRASVQNRSYSSGAVPFGGPTPPPAQAAPAVPPAPAYQPAPIYQPAPTPPAPVYAPPLAAPQPVAPVLAAPAPVAPQPVVPQTPAPVAPQPAPVPPPVVVPQPPEQRPAASPQPAPSAEAPAVKKDPAPTLPAQTAKPQAPKAPAAPKPATQEPAAPKPAAPAEPAAPKKPTRDEAPSIFDEPMPPAAPQDDVTLTPVTPDEERQATAPLPEPDMDSMEFEPFPELTPEPAAPEPAAPKPPAPAAESKKTAPAAPKAPRVSRPAPEELKDRDTVPMPSLPPEPDADRPSAPAPADEPPLLELPPAGDEPLLELPPEPSPSVEAPNDAETEETPKAAKKPDKDASEPADVPNLIAPEPPSSTPDGEQDDAPQTPELEAPELDASEPAAPELAAPETETSDEAEPQPAPPVAAEEKKGGLLPNLKKKFMGFLGKDEEDAPAPRETSEISRDAPPPPGDVVGADDEMLPPPASADNSAPELPPLPLPDEEPVSDLPSLDELRQPGGEEDALDIVRRQQAQPLDELPPLPGTAEEEASRALPKLPEDGSVPPPPKVETALEPVESADELPPPPGAEDRKPAKPAPAEQELASLPPSDEPAATSGESAPDASAGEPSLRVEFAQTETEVPLAAQANLRELARKLTVDKKKSVTVMAYASAPKEQSSLARRVSLARALAVRAFLIDLGVDNVRIGIQPLGNNLPDDGPAERADIVLK